MSKEAELALSQLLAFVDEARKKTTAIQLTLVTDTETIKDILARLDGVYIEQLELEAL